MTISVTLTDAPVGVTVSANAGAVSVSAATVTAVQVGIGDTAIPTTHGGTHASGGSDAVALAATQVASTLGTASLQGDISQLSTIVSTLGTAATYDAPGAGDNAAGGNVVLGSDTRLTNARAPTSHVHGNLTNVGAVGTTPGLPIVTGASGVLQAGSFGTSVGSVCAGNDSRLSDSRTPTSHSHAASDITSGTLARARYASDLGSGSMAVSGTNSFGVSVDGTSRTLAQANTLSVIGGPVGIGTLAPLSTSGLEVSCATTVTNREVLRLRNTASLSGVGVTFDVAIGTSGYFDGNVMFLRNGTRAFMIDASAHVTVVSALRFSNSVQIVGDSNANAYIEMNNGASQLSISSVSVISFQRSYVEVGRWDTNSNLNVGISHVTAASTGGGMAVGTQARVRYPSQVSTSAGQFAAAGDAQASRYHLRNSTADATATNLFRNGSSTLLIVPARSTWQFNIRVTAYNSADEIGAAWNVVGAIRRNAASGTALVGSVTSTAYTEGTMSGASVTVTADDTNEALQISVTGLASKAIRWHAVVETSEVSAGTPT